MFVAIGAYCWGKGDTLPKAIRNCKRMASSYSEGSNVIGYQFGEGSTFEGVDDRGSLHYNGERPTELGVVGKIGKRRG